MYFIGCCSCLIITPAHDLMKTVLKDASADLSIQVSVEYKMQSYNLSFVTLTVLLLSLAGSLLDFLKSDEGRKLKVNKLIDMAAQVGTVHIL